MIHTPFLVPGYKPSEPATENEWPADCRPACGGGL